MRFKPVMGAMSVCVIGLSAQGQAADSSSDPAKDSYFDVRCEFASELAPGANALTECHAKFRLCAQSSGSACEDQGVVTCEAGFTDGKFEGSFLRTVRRNEVVLQGRSRAGEPVPIVVMGPAKSPPRPGQPVVADSRIEFVGSRLTGECAVRLVR